MFQKKKKREKMERELLLFLSTLMLLGGCLMTAKEAVRF